MNRHSLKGKLEGYTRYMEIVFVRHGEALSNTLPIDKNIVGSDQALTAKGERQMHRTAQTLAQLALTHVITLPELMYTSPYLRTQQSAAIIAERLKLPVVVDERLREIGKGSLVDKTVEEALKYENAVLKNERHTNRPPGGENWSDIATRMTDFILERESEGGASLLIIGHNHPIECAIGKLTGQPTETWEDRPLDNASISRIVKYDKFWEIDEQLYNYRPA